MIPLEIKFVTYAVVFLIGIASGGELTSLYYTSEINAVATKAEIEKNAVLTEKNALLNSNAITLKTLEIEHDKNLATIASIPAPVRVRVPTCSVPPSASITPDAAGGSSVPATSSNGTQDATQRAFELFEQQLESDASDFGRALSTCKVMQDYLKSIP